MKRIFILLLAILMSSSSIYAQSIKGLRIESKDVPIVVFINGDRVCDPVQSCMIANLSAGYYHLEVFSALYTGEYNRYPIYDNRIYFSGSGVDKITIIDDSRGSDIGRNDRIYNQGVNVYNEALSSDEFSRLLSSIKNAPFKSDKFDVIDLLENEIRLSANQVVQIMDIFSFDDEKLKVALKLYDNIIDKHNSVYLLDKLSFSSSKQKLKSYIKNRQNSTQNHFRYNARSSNSDFSDLLASIKRASFKSDKFDIIETIAGEVGLTTQQVGQIMDLFSFDDEKLKVATTLYGNIVDKHNSDYLFDKLSFISSTDKLRDFIKSQKSF